MPRPQGGPRGTAGPQGAVGRGDERGEAGPEAIQIASGDSRVSALLSEALTARDLLVRRFARLPHRRFELVDSRIDDPQMGVQFTLQWMMGVTCAQAKSFVAELQQFVVLLPHVFNDRVRHVNLFHQQQNSVPNRKVPRLPGLKDNARLPAQEGRALKRNEP